MNRFNSLRNENIRRAGRAVRRNAARLALSATAAIAPGVEAAAAQAADQPTGGRAYPAETVPVGAKKAPEYASRPSANHLKVNNKAKKGMRTLAARVARGDLKDVEAAHVLREEIGKDDKGRTLELFSVVVPSQNLYNSDVPSGYRFDLVVPKGKNGPDVQNVQAWSVAQGQLNPEQTHIVETYTGLAMARNFDTGAIAASGTYLSPKDFNSQTLIEAAAYPSREGEAHLTADRLAAFLEQANGVIDSAIDQQPVGALGPAFSQPANTVIIPLK